jgi:hypothetical protein
MSLRILFLLSSILVSANCSPTSPTQSEALSFERLSLGTGSLKQDQPTTRIVRSAAELSTVWTELYSPSSLQPPKPDVDFTRQMLIVISIGIRTDGRSSVATSAVTYSGDALSVEATESVKGPECPATGVIVYPTDLILLARRDGSVSLKVTKVTKPCSAP